MSMGIIKLDDGIMQRGQPGSAAVRPPRAHPSLLGNGADSTPVVAKSVLIVFNHLIAPVRRYKFYLICKYIESNNNFKRYELQMDLKLCASRTDYYVIKW